MNIQQLKDEMRRVISLITGTGQVWSVHPEIKAEIKSVVSSIMDTTWNSALDEMEKEMREVIKEIKQEVKQKEGRDIDKWSETGKVVYFYVDEILSSINKLKIKQ